MAAANEAALAAAKRHIQQELDEALANSFPASDPVSIVTSQREEAWEQDTAGTPKGPVSST